MGSIVSKYLYSIKAKSMLQAILQNEVRNVGYNLIELVWHSAKEYIANKIFESVEELEKLLNKLLNEEQLIIKWGRLIKNKGNAIYFI
ncbi:hypothetical protein AsFPU1_1005 [Aphanothece sacrum FPU1]|uniref:Uncharacterized protein n=1 Tax=Aphanothece sacrum FPU1 TaxID=1920663 RepID=A0A401IEA5_APHSA|nr:hypothetical protein AsFPU1_1005 [Aphanothece sacrum FPU1]GBF87067.1 hypothetical protein AsFPU3_4148 [Aphanothece sacrum FPU3]